MSLPTTPYDRPSVALRLALQGRGRAAGTALFAPHSLAPDDLKTLGSEFYDEDDPSILKAILSVATNPVVIAGLVLAAAFPIAKSVNALAIRNSVVNFQKGFGPILSKILPWRDQIPTQLADKMDDVVVGMAHTKEKWSHGIGQAIASFNKALGRNADAAMGRDSGTRIVSHLENMVGVGQVSRELGIKAPVISKAAVSKFASSNPALHNAEVATAKAIRESLDFFKAEHGANAGKTIVGAFLESAKANRPWANLASKSRFVDFSGTADDAIAALKKYGIKASGDMDDVARAVLKQNKGRLPDFLHVDQKTIDAMHLDATKRGLSISLDHLDDYFPHQRVFGKDVVDRAFEMGAREGIDPHTIMAASSRAAGSRAKGAALSRLGRMAPDIDRLEAAWGPGSVTQDARRVMDAVKKESASRVDDLLSAVSDVDGEESIAALHKAASTFAKESGIATDEVESIMRAVQIEGMDKGVVGAKKMARSMMQAYAPAGASRTYSMDLIPVLEQHGRTMANMEWFTFRGMGKAIAADTKLLDSTRQQLMNSQYIPQLMGKQSFSKSIQSQEAMTNKLKWISDAKEGKGLFKFVPPQVRDFAVNSLESSKGGGSVGSSLASYFYTTTLGFNAPSAMKNLLQTGVTTVNVAGTKNTMAGFGATHKQIGQYVGFRAKGLNAAESFHKAFPDFIQAGLDPNPLTEQLLKGSLETAYSGAIQSAPSTAISKVKDVAMKLFQTSEQYNRLVAFNTGRAWYKTIPNAVKKGVWDAGTNTLTQEGRFARQLVQLTQFPAGPGQTPRLIENWSPLWRQFLHFPMRFTGFLATSGLRGEAGPAMLGGFNPGTIARTAASSAIAYEAGKQLLGVDLSGGLLTGALPLPAFEGAPFYPAPVVPPVLSAAGAVVQAGMEESLDPLKNMAWMMVPGGIAARRVFRAAGPGFADYKNRTEDGRIPTYSTTGTLVGNFTPAQVTMKAIGLYPQSASQERELMQYLGTQKDNIRALRRDYMEAIAEGDGKSIHEIAEEWKRKFPGLGPISVRQQDVDAVKLRKQVTRLERSLDGIPSEYRDEYARLVTQTMGPEFERMVGVSPELFEAPRSTWKSRRVKSSSYTYSGMGGSTSPYQAPVSQQFGIPTLSASRPYGISR